MSPRSFNLLLALGGLCALLGFLTSATQNRTFLFMLVPLYLVVTFWLLGAGCKADGKPVSGKPYSKKDEV